MPEKLDPLDVAALERSLNDSATRVSTIWVSFLIFALYLLIAAATVTHRQLFLAEPVKLPVLNIDLPLWGFFFLAPILFVIFHLYVLLQVLLLGRTAAAYNAAVENAVKYDSLTPDQDASLRQRLANTLFAQIFAGSPRERAGWLGFLLKAMAWITLAIAPILILAAFQFRFLPYHDPIATWTHRLLIGLELMVVFLLWPLVLDARREFARPNVWARLKHAGVMPRRLIGPKHGRRGEWQWLRAQVLPLGAFILYVTVPLSLATFPGELHVNLFTGQALTSAQCKRWVQRQFIGADFRFDRLVLPRVDVVDDEKLKKIEEATKAAGERDYQGERTQRFRDRDLNCGDFSEYADLRRVDFSGARLREADFSRAKLQGASLDRAQLQGADLDHAELQDASLNAAQLQGASLIFAQLQGASLIFAQLQGARLLSAQLQGAFLHSARLQGAWLGGALLQGAALDQAQLQGASLISARLQGATFDQAQLQGAELDGAELQGALLYFTQLQGAYLQSSLLNFTHLSGVYVWRARNAPDCGKARVDALQYDAIVTDEQPVRVKATPDVTAKFIEDSIAAIPNADMKEKARQQMRKALLFDPAKDDTAALAATWRQCEEVSRTPSREEFDRGHAEFLTRLVCDDVQTGKAIAKGVIRHWISDAEDRRHFSAQLARGLLGEDGLACLGAKDLDQRDKDRLRKLVPATSRPQAAPINE